MTWEKWKVTRKLEPEIELDGRQVYIEMLQELIEKLKEVEIYNLTGMQEEKVPVYCLPTVTFFCTDENDSDLIEIRCYRDRREFIRELKQEDEAYRRRVAQINQSHKPAD